MKAYVINSGAHLMTDKQFSTYRRLKVLQNPACAWHAENRLWTCVLACVIQRWMTRPDSDVGVCNRGLIISVLGHMFIIPSLGNTTPQHSSFTLSCGLFFSPGKVHCARAWLHFCTQKCLQMCKQSLFYLTPMLRNFKKSIERVGNEKQMLSLAHMQTKQ